MSNRLVHYLQGCIEAIFKDIAYMYSSQVDWERDKKRVLIQLESRGTNFCTLDMPAMENHLHFCLSEERFTSPPYLSKTRSARTSIPVFLESLYKRVFSIEDGNLVLDPDPNAILALKTLFSFAKKVKVECPQEKVDESIERFVQTDASLPDHFYDWDSDAFDTEVFFSGRRHISQYDWLTPEWTQFNNEDKNRIQRSFDIVASILGESPSHDVSLQERLKPGHGPGASSEQRDGGSKYNLENWSLRQEKRFPYDYYGCSALGEGSITCRPDTTSEIRGSRLIAVHKNMKGPRLIAAEPYSHMYIQKFIERSLIHRFDNSIIGKSISIKDQENNKKLASQSSIDGSYATVDLSEASDRVSLAIIECFLAVSPDWLIDIQSCRSPFVTLPDGRVITYRKLSPQGSAVTFPLQSLLYYSLCVAAICIYEQWTPNGNILRRISRSIRVYGDDIIIKTQYYGVLSRILAAFHMKVNQDKSFRTGLFRESCGRDAYAGYDVDPPRIKEVPSGNLAQLPSIVKTSNNFHIKGFWHTAEYVRSTLGRMNKFIPIQLQQRFPVSFESYTGDDLSHLDMRYNESLQRIEYKAFQPRLSSRQERLTGHARMLQYFIEEPDPLSKWTSGTAHGSSVNYRVGWAPRYF